MSVTRFPLSPELETRRHLIEQARIRSAKKLDADELLNLEQAVEDGSAVNSLTTQKGWAIVEEILYKSMDFPALATCEGEALAVAITNYQAVRRVTNRIFDVIANGEVAAERLKANAARQKEESDE